MKKSTLSIIVWATLIMIMFGSILLARQPSTKAANSAVNRMAMGMATHHPSNQNSVFEGVITNAKASPGKISGIGAYDKDCKNVGNGMTDCHAGINTNEYGVIDFNYVHNMAVDPCIVPGDKVAIEILDSNGRAKVERI